MSYKNIKKNALDIWADEKKDMSDIWIDTTESQRRRVFRKGDVVLADWGENLGSEYNSERGTLRPGVVISDEQYNHGLAIVAPTSTANITKVRRFEYKLTVAKNPFLDRETKVQVNAARCISSIRIDHTVGQLSDSEIIEINLRLKRVFNL